MERYALAKAISWIEFGEDDRKVDLIRPAWRPSSGTGAWDGGDRSSSGSMSALARRLQRHPMVREVRLAGPRPHQPRLPRGFRRVARATTGRLGPGS